MKTLTPRVQRYFELRRQQRWLQRQMHDVQYELGCLWSAMDHDELTVAIGGQPMGDEEPTDPGFKR